MRTRVTSGSEGISRRRQTLSGVLTGQVCCIVTGLCSPFSSVRTAISFSIVYVPASATLSILHCPDKSNGTITWWVKMLSGTVPSVSPAWTVSPALAVGVNSHRRSVSRPWMYIPGSRKKPTDSASCGRGFCSPS